MSFLCAQAMGLFIASSGCASIFRENGFWAGYTPSHVSGEPHTKKKKKSAPLPNHVSSNISWSLRRAVVVAQKSTYCQPSDFGRAGVFSSFLVSFFVLRFTFCCCVICELSTKPTGGAKKWTPTKEIKTSNAFFVFRFPFFVIV